MPLPLLIPAALGAAKAGMGIADMIKGKKALKNAKDPGAISQEEKSAVAAARQRALGGLPTDKLAVEAIQRNKANTMNALTKGGSSKNVLAGLLASQGLAQSDESKERALQANRKQEMMETADSMSAKLGAKKQAYEVEKHQTTVAQANQDIQTGKKNIMAGATDIGAAAISAMDEGDTDEESDPAGVAKSMELNKKNKNKYNLKSNDIATNAPVLSPMSTDNRVTLNTNKKNVWEY